MSWDYNLSVGFGSVIGGAVGQIGIWLIGRLMRRRRRQRLVRYRQWRSRGGDPALSPVRGKSQALNCAANPHFDTGVLPARLVVSSRSRLPRADQVDPGVTALVTDTDTVYVCRDGAWVISTIETERRLATGPRTVLG